MSDESQAALEAYYRENKGLAFGAQFIGLFVSALICGVNIHLFINWSMYCASWESRVVRWYVRILFLCGLLYTGFILAYSMELFVYGFGDYGRWTDLEWIGWVIIFQGVFRPAISFYFAEKAWRLLDRSKWFALVIGTTILGSFAAMIGLRAVFMSDRKDLLSVFNFLRIGLEALGDVLITAALLVGIYRKKADFEHTQRLQRKMSMVILESQLPPTIFILGFLIVCVTSSGGMSGGTRFFICGPSVYLLCLLGVMANKSGMDTFDDHTETFALKARQNRSPPVITVRTEQVVHTSPADAAMVSTGTQPRVFATHTGGIDTDSNVSDLDEKYTGEESIDSKDFVDTASQASNRRIDRRSSEARLV